MLRSTFVAAGALLAIFVVGLAATAIGFGRAPAADRILISALQKLGHYRRDEATIETSGRIVHVSCSDRRRRTTMVVDHRTRVRERDNHLVGRTSLAEQLEFDLSGCPAALSTRLANNLSRHGEIVAATYRDGYEVTLTRSHPELALLVTRAGIPYELRLEGRRMRGTSRVDFGVRA
jgi:hypothetical protein